MRARLATLGAALLLASAPALADVPPEPGYVEQCTAAKQQKPAMECVGCSTYYAKHDKCPKLLESAGFTKACQSRGASTWTEVWCRSAGSPPLSPEVAKEV